ncbi:MAG: hypothetical protein RIS68_347 [Bacteroidota bacterium]
MTNIRGLNLEFEPIYRSFIHRKLNSMKKYYLVGFVLLFIACGKKEETILPTEGPITESIYASGILKSQDQYQAFVTVNGIIEHILVKEGDVVRVGQPILQLSNETQKMSTENAQIAANFADKAANQGKLNEAQNVIETSFQKFKLDSSIYARQKNLWAQQVGTRIDLEQKEMAFQNSKTNYLSSIQRYRDLKRQISFSADQSKKSVEISSRLQQDFTLRSKMNGVVFSISKNKGELVSPQMPIAVIGNPEAFVLEMQVDENDILQLSLGQRIIVRLDSYKNEVFEAAVTKIYPYMNERSKTFLVEAKFSKAPKKLFPFMNFEANIILQTKEKALLVPRNYLIGDSLITLKGGEKRKVKIGLKDFQQAEIIQGLTKTDELVKP